MVDLALLDVTTGFESISEDGRTRTVHQRLPRHLHLATCAAQYVAQDLPKNVSSRRLLWLATAGGTGLSRNGDLEGPNNDRLETPILNRLAQFGQNLTEHITPGNGLPARICRNGTRLTASRDPIVATWPYLIAETATGC